MLDELSEQSHDVPITITFVTSRTDKQPPLLVAHDLTFEENTEQGEVIGRVFASDGIFGSGIDEFTLLGPASDFFEIDDQGRISLSSEGADSPINNFEHGPNQVNVTVAAEDRAGNTSEAKKLEIRTLDRPDTAQTTDTSEPTLDLHFIGDALLGMRQEVSQAFQAAWNDWTSVLDGAPAAEIDIAVGDRNTGGPETLASARPTFVDTGLTTVDGSVVLQSQVVAELRDGTERAPNEADARVDFAQSLDNFDFGNPRQPKDFDAETVVKHELGHLLGFASTPAGDGVKTPLEAGTEAGLFSGLHFQGDTAGTVPLANSAHLTDGLMAPSIAPGNIEKISETELAVLDDIGVPVSDNALNSSSADPMLA